MEIFNTSTTNGDQKTITASTKLSLTIGGWFALMVTLFSLVSPLFYWANNISNSISDFEKQMTDLKAVVKGIDSLKKAHDVEIFKRLGYLEKERFRDNLESKRQNINDINITPERSPSN